MSEDIFGTALADYHAGDRSVTFEWHRDDDTLSHQDFHGLFAGLNGFEREGMNFAEDRILDIGCGAGKHLLAFQERGLDCMGIDFSHDAIAICKERGVRQCVHANAFSLPFEDASFGSVTLFSNGLSIGGTPLGVTNLMRELARVVKDGGTLISFNRDVSRGGNEIDKSYRKANLSEGRSIGQVRMRGCYDGRFGHWFDWMFVAPKDFVAYGAKTGWGSQHIVKGSSGGDYCGILKRGAA